MTARPLGSGLPVAGGRDLDLPGAGIRLRGTRWAGTGPPVLLLHGLASQRRFWNLVATRLAGLPVVALDARGHGDSDKPEPGGAAYAAETVVADTLAALDALGLSRIVAVGHSWGATIALELAARSPERVLAVVCLDGGFASPLRHLSRDEALVALQPPRLAVPPDELEAHLRAGPLGRWWSDEVAEAVLPIFEVAEDGLARARLTFERHMAIVSGMLDSDPLTVMSGVAVPTWLLSAEPFEGWGDRSERVAAREEALERAPAQLREPRIIRAIGALHDVPLQWPALVTGIIRGAVEEVTPR